MTFELKTLHAEALPRALEKAERYRLLNEPSEAESICLDVLAIDRDNQAALVTLLLALTDQFETAHRSPVPGLRSRFTPSLPRRSRGAPRRPRDIRPGLNAWTPPLRGKVNGRPEAEEPQRGPMRDDGGTSLGERGRARVGVAGDPG